MNAPEDSPDIEVWFEIAPSDGRFITSSAVALIEIKDRKREIINLFKILLPGKLKQGSTLL